MAIDPTNCGWVSCNLIPNDLIGPLQTDGAPTTCYQVCQTVNGIALPDVYFVLDQTMCGSIVPLKDIQTTTLPADKGGPIVNPGGGGETVECCNTSAILSGTTLTINQSNGTPINVDLSTLAGGMDTVTTLTNNGDNTYTYTNEIGQQTLILECCNTNASLNGTVLTIAQSNSNPISVDLASLAGGGGGTECCNTAASLSGNVLTISQSNGTPVSVDLSALAGTGGGTECCNTGLSLVGTTLTIDQSNGSPLSVDLAGLGGGGTECCNTGIALSGTTLTVSQSNGTPVSVDLATLQSEECCNTALTFDDTTNILTLTQSNGATLTATVPDGGIGTVECCNTSLVFDDATDVLTLTQSNGSTLTTTLPSPAGCATQTTCPNGATGCQVGCYVMGDTPIDAGGNSTVNSNWLEDNFPAAGFCEWYSACIVNATGSQSEDWIVLKDAQGQLGWHQRA